MSKTERQTMNSINSNHKTIAEEKWYAIYTLYKSEKQVAEHIKRKGIEVFLPLMTRTRKYRRKIKTYQVPIINCYLFVKIVKSQQSQVLETENVFKFIKQGGQLTAIPQEELEILRRIEGVDIDIASRVCEFNIGDEVEVCQGSLVGLKGKLIRQSGKKSFVVELMTIGIELQINVDLTMIRKINNISTLIA